MDAQSDMRHHDVGRRRRVSRLVVIWINWFDFLVVLHLEVGKVASLYDFYSS